MTYCLQALGGSTIYNNSMLKQNLEKLALDVESNTNSTKREKYQLNALQLLSTSNAAAAITQWENILVEFPSDILSLHLAGLTCLMHGCLGKWQIRWQIHVHYLFLSLIRTNSRYFWSYFALISRRVYT